MLAKQRDLEEVRAGLGGWLRRKMPEAERLEIVSMQKPSAGLSNETFLFDLSWRAGGAMQQRRLVLRLRPTDFMVFPEYDLAKQYRVMAALRDSDVPVPPVWWLEDDESILGCPFYVMERVEGQIPSEVPPYHAYGDLLEATPEQRARLWWSGIETLARIHRLDWKSRGLSFLGVPGPGTDPLDRQIDYYERYLEWIGGAAPQPVLHAALDWLRANRFEPPRLALCWGDARLPNMIFRDGEVAAVLDWEMVFLGDPGCDLGWWIVLDSVNSEGYGIPRLEGFPSAEETVRRYEDLTGWKVENPLYYDVMATMRFGVIMARVASRMKEVGVPTPTPDFESNNSCTQRLARLLDLPQPGAERQVTDVGGATCRIQFHLTGPQGGDWYIVSEQGKARRGEGAVEEPQVTLTASAADWNAIQAGTLDRTQAYLGGKIKVEGDVTLLMQLEDAIRRLS